MFLLQSKTLPFIETIVQSQTRYFLYLSQLKILKIDNQSLHLMNKPIIVSQLMDTPSHRLLPPLHLSLLLEFLLHHVRSNFDAIYHIMVVQQIVFLRSHVNLGMNEIMVFLIICQQIENNKIIYLKR